MRIKELKSDALSIQSDNVPYRIQSSIMAGTTEWSCPRDLIFFFTEGTKISSFSYIINVCKKDNVGYV